MRTLPLAARAAVIGVAILAAPAVVPGAATPAWAQAEGMGGSGSSDTITVRARVKSVNLKTRHVTLVGPQGNSFVVAVGPEVRNLAQVKPGSMVIAHYHASVVYVLAAPGSSPPPDTLSVAGGRAAPGQMPAGAVGTRLVITGLVVGVDPVGHTISVVDPKGGAVRTFDVVDPERQRQLARVNVGDTITAVYTEAVAVAIEPAR